MAQLRLVNPRVDAAATASLRRIKRLAAKYHPKELNGAVIAAGAYAKKVSKDTFVYEGNQYMHLVYRLSTEPREYLNAINNGGKRVVSVSPDLTVTFYDVDRGVPDETPMTREEIVAEYERVARERDGRAAGVSRPRSRFSGPKELAAYLEQRDGRKRTFLQSIELLSRIRVMQRRSWLATYGEVPFRVDLPDIGRTRKRYAVVHRDPHAGTEYHNKWRISWFDARGASGHSYASDYGDDILRRLQVEEGVDLAKIPRKDILLQSL